MALFPGTAACERETWNSGVAKTNTEWCVLNLNMIYGIIFLLFWIWLIILAIFTSMHILTTILSMALTPTRRCALIVGNIRTKGFKKYEKWDHVCKKQTIQDWHVIQLYKKNVNSRIFERFMEDISKLDSESERKEV